MPSINQLIRQEEVTLRIVQARLESFKVLKDLVMLLQIQKASKGIQSRIDTSFIPENEASTISVNIELGNPQASHHQVYETLVRSHSVGELWVEQIQLRSYGGKEVNLRFMVAKSGRTSRYMFALMDPFVPSSNDPGNWHPYIVSERTELREVLLKRNQGTWYS